jgi:hypothetical protein
VYLVPFYSYVPHRILASITVRLLVTPSETELSTSLVSSDAYPTPLILFRPPSPSPLITVLTAVPPIPSRSTDPAITQFRAAGILRIPSETHRKHIISFHHVVHLPLSDSYITIPRPLDLALDLE